MFTPSATIAFIGFGETGGLLGAALARRGCAVRAWDILLDQPDSRAAMQERIEEAGADPAFCLADCLRGAKLVISAVPASSAGKVAAEAGRLLQPGQIFLDIDSVCPALDALGFATRTVASQLAARHPRRGELP